MKCDIDTVDLVIDSKIKAKNVFYACNDDSPQKSRIKDDPPSDESLSDDACVEDNEGYESRQSRPSNYYQGVQQFNRRSSNGDSVLRSKNKQVEVKRERDTFTRLIWGGYHKIAEQKTRDSHLGEENADEEATVIGN